MLNKNKQKFMNELLKVIVREEINYSDPITQFVKLLHGDANLEAAQAKLKECKLVFEIDYFLHKFYSDFLESARMSIFDAYCHIHREIDLKFLASKLSMNPGDAEVWIVNLIRNAKLLAKIDSKTGKVIMSGPFGR